MTTTTTDRDEVFTDEQRVRAEALREARGVIVKSGFFAANEVTVPTNELVDLAEYIIRGTHPLDRYEGDRPDEERCEGCSSTEIATHDSEGVPLCAGCDKADRDDQAADADEPLLPRQLGDGGFVPALPARVRIESFEAARADD
ncbi:hypothetical protein ACH473_10580 [Cellulosimicrobium funkei]|uniref:hypothetical protein n=1 Tax=Cellulosimicrobium funkei TaxID=264251 RepID=UPI0037BC2A49